MSFSRAFQWYNSHLDPIWPDGTFKDMSYLFFPIIKGRPSDKQLSAQIIPVQIHPHPNTPLPMSIRYDTHRRAFLIILAAVLNDYLSHWVQP